MENIKFENYCTLARYSSTVPYQRNSEISSHLSSRRCWQ